MQMPKEDIPQRRPAKKRTGEMLVEMGLLTQEQVDEALGGTEGEPSAHR